MDNKFEQLRQLQAGQKIRPRGVHCAFVGCDGAGKTTATESVMKSLGRNGVRSTVFKSFDHTDKIWRPSMQTKRLIREDPNPIAGVSQFDQTLHTVRFFDRIQGLLPELEQNPVVLCDRYILDRIALIRWDTGEANSAPEVFLRQLIRNNLVPIPDITFYLKVDVETAFRRITSRGAEIEEKEKPHNLAKTITHLDELSREELFQPVITVDARYPLDCVVNEMLEHIICSATRRVAEYSQAALVLSSSILAEYELGGN